MSTLRESSAAAPTTAVRGETAPIRVLVADAFPLLREGIQCVVDRQPGLRICGYADHPHEIVEAIANSQPHVVVIACTLSATATFTLIKELRVRYETMPVLLLAFSHDPALAGHLRPFGVHVAMAMTQGPDCLVWEIYRLARGVNCTDVQAGQKVAAPITVLLPEPSGGDSPCFTEREEEILELIGSGLTSREIAKSLRLRVKTVESHRHNIKQKLGFKTAARLAQYAFQRLQSRRPPP